MFAFLEKAHGTPSASVYDPVAKVNVFKTNRQLEVMVEQWQTIFSIHKDNPHDWEQFLATYGQYYRPATQAPTDPPPAEAMHRRAQKAAELTAAGSDGWKPFELNALPLLAWVYRRRILCLAAELGFYPSS